MTPLLSVRDVTIAYPTEHGRFTAVEGVTFAVRDGERFVLLGPSGCGKSTLLRVIIGLETPTSGQVLYRGKVQAGLNPAAALFPNSVPSNVSMVGVSCGGMVAELPTSGKIKPLSELLLESEV